MIRSHTNHTRDTTQAGGSAAPPTCTASQDRPSVRVLAVIRSNGSRFKLSAASTSIDALRRSKSKPSNRLP
jgi:hypothetical protein